MLVFILLFAGIFLFMPLSIPDSALLWLRTLGIWAFAAAFMIADRFLLTSFSYAIEKDGDTLDLRISELHFKRIRTVCRVSVFCVAGIEHASKDHPHAIPRGAKKFNYCSELFPKKYCILKIEDGDEVAFLKISPDDGLISLIIELSGYKKIDKIQ